VIRRYIEMFIFAYCKVVKMRIIFYCPLPYLSHCKATPGALPMDPWTERHVSILAVLELPKLDPDIAKRR